MARKLNAQAIATIKRRMLAVPKRLRDAAEGELKRTAEIMANDMRRDIEPVSGNLRDSITVRVAEDEADQVLIRVAVDGKDGFYGRFVEYGYISEEGRMVPAHPFFFPNYRRHKRRIRAALLRALRRTAAKL
ncbi:MULTISPECIES: HK97 gp10 family phage protein [unclassified Brevundimonas]|uniref:HK97 gp10 family phage protein n=1 Tax=unclassified Brevundimonas TaxID=2622653 RepID=UPI0025BD1B33|nr:MULTISPECIES: HK97 gp10 family phage protein [unclassified Brevundimonas]